MNEIYWLTRLDGIQHMGNLFLVLSVFALIAVFAAKVEFGSLDDEDCFIPKWTAKIGVTLAIVGALIVVFVPSKKDALLILGVGGTIDYIESNETAKQLPDKCVKALEKFAKDYISEDD